MLNNEKGMTLIEILAAMVILSMLVFIVLNLTTYSTKSLHTSDQLTIATRLAD
jgi:prepilin-type N-terminal cleavage/methylation domain-containing protein